MGTFRCSSIDDLESGLLDVLGFSSHSTFFSLIWRRHHYWWRATNFEICSTLMVIEQWEFFNMPHQLWNGPTFYNGHLRGPVTITPVAKRLAVEMTLPVLMTWVCRGWDSNSQPFACEPNVLTDCITAVALKMWSD